MEPRFVTRDPFTVAGLKCRTTMENNLIPALWDDFNQRAQELAPIAIGRCCYGVCFNEETDDPTQKNFFSYLAGMEVGSAQNLPSGMEARELPAADYAVFEHRGPLDTLQETYHAIYHDWLPNSAYAMFGSQDFELYDQRFKFNDPASILEIWVPIQKK